MDSHSPLSVEELLYLDQALKAQGGMPLFKLHGYLTGIISAPLCVAPEAWLPWIWEAGPSLKRPTDAMEEAIPFIFRLYYHIAKQLENRKRFLPLLSYEEEPYEQASTNNLVLQQWCKGYLSGIHLKDDKHRFVDEDTAPFYIPILILASDDETVQRRLKEHLADKGIDQLRQLSREALPKIIMDVYQYWREREEAAAESAKEIIAEMGFNDPCPCGSGKVYQQCCWQKILN